MERIKTLLEKIQKLNNHPSPSVIDADLMLDYIKVMYADVIEWRNKLVFTSEDNEKAVSETESKEVKEPEDSVADKDYIVTEESFTTEEKTKVAPKNPEEADKEEIKLTIPSISAATPFVTSRQDVRSQDIRNYIDINEKFTFIRELFDENTSQYEATLNEIIHHDNSYNAIQWLKKNTGKEKQWQEDDYNVQEFFKLIEGYFSKRDN